MKNDPILKDHLKTLNPDELNVLTNLGFRYGERGTHTSRTIMLQELTLLFQSNQKEATRQEYLDSIINDNSLGKPTMSTRKISAQRLTELYGLIPSIPLFRLMSYFWYIDQSSQPLLALLIALARDPLLRITAIPILNLQAGDEFSRSKFNEILEQSAQNRFNEGTLDRVVRNTASSWTQSGHLTGRVIKIRQLVTPTPVVTTYALLLGYLAGYRGESLFSTLWAKVLDMPKSKLIDLALDAKRLGLLEMSQAGGVTTITFANLLTQEERRLIHGSN